MPRRTLLSANRTTVVPLMIHSRVPIGDHVDARETGGPTLVTPLSVEHEILLVSNDLDTAPNYQPWKPKSLTWARSIDWEIVNVAGSAGRVPDRH
jgi:hypothetical protein